MSELPKGWITETLGNLVVVERGSSPRPIKSFLTDNEDGVNWIKIGDATKGQKLITSTAEKITKEGALKSRFVDVGDFILSNSMSFGLPYIMGISGYIHDGWFVFRLPKEISSDYFYYLLSSSFVSSQFNSLAVGGVVKNISGDLVKKAELPLPPLPEQKRIVEKLDEVLAQVHIIKARLDGIPDLLKRFRQSVLASAVSGKLTEEWRLEHSLSAGTELKELFQVRKDICSRIGKKDKELKRVTNSESKEEIPESWVYSTLDPFLDVERAGMKTGPFGSLLKKHEHLHEGVPVLGIENISSGTFVTGSKIHISEEKSEELSMYDIVGGDLIISRSGTVGDICVVPDNLGTLRFSTNLMRVSFLRNSIDSRYFCFLFLGSRYVLRQVSSLCKGSTRDFLNQKILGSIFYPVPPLAEQKEIVRLVDQYFAFADTIEAQVKKAQVRVDNLTQSILAKAFRGELVPQDPNDEPAEVLLERIAKARKEAEALAKAAKKAGNKKASD